MAPPPLPAPHATARPAYRRLLRAAAVVIALLVALLGGLYLSACETSGRVAEGARRARVEASPQWQGDRFVNRLPRVEGSPWEMAQRWVSGGSEHATPARTPPTLSRTRADYASPPASGLRVTWLGHSTLLLEIGGRRVLVDPVWGERASPFSIAGPARWYAPPLPLEELPAIDAVVISHDHYDHLDHPTVLALADEESPLRQTGLVWAVPLGIGAHLEYWGVAPGDIRELDWWESTSVEGLTLTATPARHFSGRSMTFGDADQTLWAGWAIASSEHRVFYSGDTAMHDAFATIKERLGPFDLTLLEVGAYHMLWRDVHLGPEQAVRAHQLLGGAAFLPVHWGLFDLALHGWTEPIERVLVEAERAGVKVIAPRPGEMIEPASPPAAQRWWPDVPWESAEVAPAYSSHVDALIDGIGGFSPSGP